MRWATAAAAALAAASTSVHAYPEGAPWGAANPAAAESCSTCHFDAEPTLNSAALEIIGLPRHPVAGRQYPLELTLAAADTVTAGFQLVVASDGDTGWFSTTSAKLDSEGGAVRSNEPEAPIDGQAVSWSFVWQAPAELTLPAIFFAAATAANDDGSPLGDAIHYRAFVVEEPPGDD